ncbi:hypothetical protein PMIN06_001755 [Paraphaeosphaeria minitans]
MSFLRDVYNDPLFGYLVPVLILLLGLQGGSIYLTQKGFKKHPDNPPLPRYVQRLLLWGARLRALFCVWYLGVLFHVGPRMLSPSEDKHLVTIYSWGKSLEQVDVEYMLLTASTSNGTLNLKFLQHPLGFAWVWVLLSRKQDSVPVRWKVPVAMDMVHHALAYSYLGRVWGQRDGGLLGKRVLQWSMVVHLVCGLLGDAGALVLNHFVDASYLGENRRDRVTSFMLAVHLVAVVFEMTQVEEGAAKRAIAGLVEKVDPTSERLRLVSPRNTKKTPLAPSPTTREKEDGGRQSADKSRAGS